MSNLGFHKAVSDADMNAVCTQVGDRYVVEALKANNWELGGEASGHVLCSDLNSTGDGIVAALQVVLALAESGRTLAELKTGMSKFPQTMINVRLSAKVDISNNQVINDAVTAAETELAGRGRVLLRPSGTEPLIRVMVEGEDQALVNKLVASLAETVEQQVG